MYFIRSPLPLSGLGTGLIIRKLEIHNPTTIVRQPKIVTKWRALCLAFATIKHDSVPLVYHVQTHNEKKLEPCYITNNENSIIKKQTKKMKK